MVSCSPGIVCTRSTRISCRISRAWPNSSGFDRWLTSPVCTTKAGACGSALMSAIARRRLPTTSGLASLRKPICVSLICTKVSAFVGGRRGRAGSRRAERARHAAGNGPDDGGAGPGGETAQRLAAGGIVAGIGGVARAHRGSSGRGQGGIACARYTDRTRDLFPMAQLESNWRRVRRERRRDLDAAPARYICLNR